MDLKPLIRELAQHAVSKKGAQQDSSYRLFDVLEDPHVTLPEASWGKFFEICERDGDLFAEMPVVAAALTSYRAKYPSIRQTDHVERDGHVYMAIPLNADLSVEFLTSLIDEAYALVWNKLDDQQRLKIELADLPYDEPKLLDRLIDLHDLQDHRRDIHRIAKSAVLLRTRRTTESRIPLGASKIGGRPDLPAEAEWPVFSDGKPLAFLAQLDLAEIAKVARPLAGLPSAGLLSILSVWGWMHEDGGDPITPGDEWDEQEGWTKVIYTPVDATLERRRKPRGVNAFKAATAEPVAILSLPNHSDEPPLAALDWSEAEYERFDQMQSDYRTIQMGHYLDDSNAFASHHQLGGYALLQQYFPEEMLEMGLGMFLQLGTDDKTRMIWGDGGELTFYADTKALAEGRLEGIRGTCQGG